ncbi:cytochrome bd-I oxidase subunit CydX [Legionella hackeliae]|uniref:Cyd operon protein YbgT n=1 Tax=Legionella hackeliae TaxID=449 RepID=A0A0A8UR39_LEGHA|nr:cytochrome bd-I oxidase subunit CydX [Legionella hackeliae]CEK09986.1 Cyd operon protein YbgT [Legionella hackeliae]STX49900.1 Predicted outer membrane lipoprotein [Legionella hackeliae]
MWYFSWILGTGLACTFAVLNAMWLELRLSDKDKEQNSAN